jgi:hypothetical protein
MVAMTSHDQDTRKRYGLDVVPPETVASPTQIRGNDGEVPWWTPGWKDLARHLGWKWIFALPAVVILGLAAGSLWSGQFLYPLWFIGMKVAAVCLLIPFLLLLEMGRLAINARKEPFCIHCGYGLTGLPDNHACPECGREYSFGLIEEYRRDPNWFKERYRMRHEIPRSDQPFHAGNGSTPHDGT